MTIEELLARCDLIRASEKKLMFFDLLKIKVNED